MLMEITTEAQTMDWGSIIIQSLITIGIVFGGAGFWEFIKTKFQAKREDKKAGDTASTQIDKIADQVNEMSSQMTSLTADMQELKIDLSLLQKANEETVKYRELRDQQDKKSAKVQEAIIQSLMGILRERLVENYHRCQEKGYYSKEEREVYRKMYECYTQDPFNGNGVIHQLQPVMEKMPWTEEEAKKLKNKKMTV